MNTNPQRICAALCKIKRFGQPVTDDDWRKVRRDAARLQADLSMMLDQPVEVHPYAYTTEYADHFLHLMRYRWGEMRSKVNQDVDYTHWIGWGGSPQPGICGRANAPDKCWTYETCGYRTHIHEFGHLLGLGHSAESGEPGDYGDELSIMGNAGENRIYIAPHRMLLGTYEGKVARFEENDQARSYRLMDSQIFGHSMPEDGIGFLEVETSEGLIGVGYDMGRIRLYRPNQNAAWAKTEVFNKDVWETQVGGVWIKRGQKHNGLIGVHVSKQPFAPVPVKQFELPTSPNPDELGDIEGIWNNAATYQGLVIWKPRANHPAADIIVGWVTWDRIGDPRWCYMLARREGEVLRGNIVSTERVNLANTATVAEGEGVLYRDGQELIFHYNTKSLSTRKLRLTKSAQAAHSDLTGWYGMEGIEHEGLWVSTYTSNQVVAYWLKHTTDFTLKGNEQQWYIIQGERSELGVPDAFAIYEPEWTQRTWGTGKKGLTQVGTATLTEDMDVFEHTLDGRSKTNDLYRVFSFN